MTDDQLTPSIYFCFNGVEHEIELAPDLAPVAIGRLVAMLPMRIDIHCAKIAGPHIFWHTPFAIETERSVDIMTLAAGTFLYWPERQFLELIYGDLQAETASVSVLGRLKGDIGWLRDMGRMLIDRHGHETIWAELRAGHGSEALRLPAAGDIDPDLAWLVAARRNAWEHQPLEVNTLLARRGIMQPFGPLIMAEGEWRKLHELLWRVRYPTHERPETSTSATVRFLIDAFVARIDGFCGMHETGAVLQRAATLIESRRDLSDHIVEELILYTGRMAAWLDLYIPWSAANELVLKTTEARTQFP